METKVDKILGILWMTLEDECPEFNKLSMDEQGEIMVDFRNALNKHIKEDE